MNQCGGSQQGVHRFHGAPAVLKLRYHDSPMLGNAGINGQYSAFKSIRQCFGQSDMQAGTCSTRRQLFHAVMQIRKRDHADMKQIFRN